MSKFKSSKDFLKIKPLNQNRISNRKSTLQIKNKLKLPLFSRSNTIQTNITKRSSENTNINDKTDKITPLVKIKTKEKLKEKKSILHKKKQGAQSSIKRVSNSYKDSENTSDILIEDPKNVLLNNFVLQANKPINKNFKSNNNINKLSTTPLFQIQKSLNAYNVDDIIELNSESSNSSKHENNKKTIKKTKTSLSLMNGGSGEESKNAESIVKIDEFADQLKINNDDDKNSISTINICDSSNNYTIRNSLQNADKNEQFMELKTFSLYKCYQIDKLTNKLSTKLSNSPSKSPISQSKSLRSPMVNMANMVNMLISPAKSTLKSPTMSPSMSSTMSPTISPKRSPGALGKLTKRSLSKSPSRSPSKSPNKSPKFKNNDKNKTMLTAKLGQLGPNFLDSIPEIKEGNDDNGEDSVHKIKSENLSKKKGKTLYEGRKSSAFNHKLDVALDNSLALNNGRKLLKQKSEFLIESISYDLLQKNVLNNVVDNIKQNISYMNYQKDINKQIEKVNSIVIKIIKQKSEHLVAKFKKFISSEELQEVQETNHEVNVSDSFL